METDDDSALLEYFLVGELGAIYRPTHHIFPLIEEDKIVCSGLPMVFRHFNDIDVEDPIYKVEDPHGIITSAYQVAYSCLADYAAKRRQELQRQEPVRRRGRIGASIFTFAVSYRHP